MAASYLDNLDESQLDQLAASGMLSADVVAQAKARRYPGVEMGAIQQPQDPTLNTSADPYNQMAAQPQAAPQSLTPQAAPQLSTSMDPYSQVAPSPQLSAQEANMTQQSNLNVAQQAPYAANAINTSMQSAGMAPATVPQPVQQAVPTPEQEQQQMIAQQEAQQAVTREIANNKAAQVGAVQQAHNEQKQMERAAELDAANEEKVEKDLEEDGPSWGTRIGQAVAILIGGISQGYSGARENPAIVAIEKAAAAKANAKKYTDEQKMKLEELLLKKAQLAIDQKKNTVDSMIGLKKLEQAGMELQMKLQELGAKKSENMLLKQTRFSPEEARAIPADQREKLNLVRLPDGSYQSALSSKQAESLYQINTDTDSGLMMAQKIMEKIDHFGNNPLKKLTDREAIAEVKGYAQALVGAMRLPYVGTGAFTDTEQRLLKDIIGDPTKVFSLAKANKATLQSVMDKLKYYRKQAMRNAGIDMPLSNNEKALQEYRQQRPNLSEGQAISNLRAVGVWDSNEL